MNRNRESGFALLLVFAMAAIIAITLYVALPRVSFEAQRDKEALLIERGEQYKRAIQLYVRKFKRYPAKMEDLDNSNGLRFLRHRYTDPMTGKDEWRLIHAGPGGVLLDSLVKKDPAEDKKQSGQTSISELLGIGGLPVADATANPALRKRPSDQQSPPNNTNGATPPGTPIPPDSPQFTGTLAGVQNPGNPFPRPGAPAIPGGLPVPNPTNPTAPATAPQGGGISGGLGIGGVAPTAPAPVPVPQGGLPGGVPGGIPGGLPGRIAPQPQNPATPGTIPNSGATPNVQGSTQASDLIRNLLTTPRPGGLAGLQNAQAAQPQTTIGGGIAGVASTIKTGVGIKIYDDQDEYKKWEFVYDPAKEAQQNGQIPQPIAPPGKPIGQPAPAAGAPTTPPK